MAEKELPSITDANAALPSISDANAALPSIHDANIGAPLAWSDVPEQAIRHTPESALNLGKAVVQPFIHPVETATAFKNIGQGVLEKAGILSPDDHEKYADAVGKFFMDRYGSAEGIKNTLATDPVGALADLSTVLTGGGTAAVRVPGVVGRIGEAASIAGRYTDPLLGAAKTVQGLGNVGAHVIGGVGTHTGPEAIQIAAQAGREGGFGVKGPEATSFVEHLQGAAPMEEPVKEAQSVVADLRRSRGQQYERDMQGVKSRWQILDFNDVDRAIRDVEDVNKFKGVDLSASTQKVRQEIKDLVNDWKGYAPAQYHTAEGFDALKKSVGHIMNDETRNTQERLIASQVYHAVRDTIMKNAPEYGNAMEGYEKASNQINELERTLSLKPDAVIDTALRKLQSTLRDNVNTSYGRRRELAQYLVDNGAPNLLYKLAGQTMKPYLPRGLGRFAMSLGAEVAAIISGGFAGGLHGAAVMAAVMPLMSPHIVGAGAYGLGAASKYMPGLQTYQLGRVPLVSGQEGMKCGGRVAKSFRYRGA